MTLADGTTIVLHRRSGLRAWFYRGRRRSRRLQLGRLANGIAFHYAAYLR